MIGQILALIVGAAIQPQIVPEPPIQFTVHGTGVERTIAEFMDVCFRTKWSLDDVRKAAEKSDPTYVEKPREFPNAFAWDSVHAHLALLTLPEFSQCALSIGSNQPRTGGQLLAMLRPAVEAELGHSVQENDSKFYLEWTDQESGYIERVGLGLATSEPSQAIWYFFDKAAPGFREKMESLMQPAQPPSE